MKKISIKQIFLRVFFALARFYHMSGEGYELIYLGMKYSYVKRPPLKSFLKVPKNK